MKKSLIVLMVLGVVLALTNPDVEDFHTHIRERHGVAGALGVAAAELLGGGIKRQDFLVASRFYIGGDGLLPRENLGWGVAGKIWASKK